LATFLNGVTPINAKMSLLGIPNNDISIDRQVAEAQQINFNQLILNNFPLVIFVTKDVPYHVLNYGYFIHITLCN
jgi:hypothetical protein